MADQPQITVTSHPSWTSFIVYMVILVMGIGGALFGGYQMGKVKGTLIAFKQSPPNSYYGAGVVVDQSTKHIGYMFGIKPAKAWGIGICHD